MKRPEELKAHEVAEQERQRAREEESKRETVNGLARSFEDAVRDGAISSTGGRLELSGFTRPGKSIEKVFAIAKDYLDKLGWECRYETQEDSDFSLTTRSSYTYTRHFLVLSSKQEKTT